MDSIHAKYAPGGLLAVRGPGVRPAFRVTTPIEERIPMCAIARFLNITASERLGGRSTEATSAPDGGSPLKLNAGAPNVACDPCEEHVPHPRRRVRNPPAHFEVGYEQDSHASTRPPDAPAMATVGTPAPAQVLRTHRLYAIGCTL